MGCLFVFGRMIAQACYGIGAMVTMILMRGITFVLVTVIGPLWLGSVREFVVRALRITRNGRPVHSGWQIGSQPAYAALSGVAWVAGYFLLRALWRLVGWVGAELTNRLTPNLAPWLPMTLVIVLVFALGALVGARVHRREQGVDSGW